MRTISDEEVQIIENLTRADLRHVWDTCNHLSRFEAWADLYYRRYGRLSPGKDDPCQDSSDPENHAQCKAWHSSGLASLDAILEVVRLQEKCERLERGVEELQDDAIRLRQGIRAAADIAHNAPDSASMWQVVSRALDHLEALLESEEA